MDQKHYAALGAAFTLIGLTVGIARADDPPYQSAYFQNARPESSAPGAARGESEVVSPQAPARSPPYRRPRHLRRRRARRACRALRPVHGRIARAEAGATATATARGSWG